MTLKWAENSLATYLKFGAKDASIDERRGKSDGKRNWPPSDASELSAYEMQLVADGNGTLAKFTRHRGEEMNRLDREHSRLEHERDTGYRSKRDGLQRDKDTTIENLRTTHGPDSALITGLSEKRLSKRQVVQHIELELNRPLRVHFVKVYLLFLMLLTLAEVPINKLAFEFFFEESPIIALGIALMVGVLLISLAHIVGVWLRQVAHYRTVTSKIFTSLAILLIVAIVALLIYFIAALRQHFVDFIETEQSFNLSQFLQQGGLSAVTTNLGQIELGTASLTLMCINVAIVLFGVVLSFLRHDPHPDYEKAKREHDHVEKQLQKAREHFDKRSSAIEQEFDGKISYLDKAIEQIDSQLHEVDGSIEGISASDPEATKLVRQVIQQRVLAYQSGNSVSRTTPPPKYFGAPTVKWLSEAISIPS